MVDFGKTGFYATSPQALPSLVPQAMALDRRIIREHAKEHFGHVRMVDEYLQAYEVLLNAASDARESVVPARES